MSHVDIKKLPCRFIEGSGQEPSLSAHGVWDGEGRGKNTRRYAKYDVCVRGHMSIVTCDQAFAW